jgi:hypothetical protein
MGKKLIGGRHRTSSSPFVGRSLPKLGVGVRVKTRGALVAVGRAVAVRDHADNVGVDVGIIVTWITTGDPGIRITWAVGCAADRTARVFGNDDACIAHTVTTPAASTTRIKPKTRIRKSFRGYRWCEMTSCVAPFGRSIGSCGIGMPSVSADKRCPFTY